MLKTIKYYIQQSWLLLISSFIFGLIVAVFYISWQPKIKENRGGKLDKQIEEITGCAVSTERVDGTFIIDDKTTTELFKIKNSENENVGFAFQAAGPAYDVIELVIVIDSNCEEILGYGVLTCNETPGFGDKIKYDFFKSQFKKIPVGDLKIVKSGDPAIKDAEIVAISGATITSQGAVNIFNNYLAKIKQQLKEKRLIQ